MVQMIYRCEVCGARYDTLEMAKTCEEQPLLGFDGIKVGDIVTTDSADYGRFGWYDGDDAWVIHKPTHLHGPSDSAWSLIYIVTAVQDIRLNSHDVKYHLETKGMSEQGYRAGYTTVHHYKLRRITDRKILSRINGRDLIGHEFGRLL